MSEINIDVIPIVVGLIGLSGLILVNLLNALPKWLRVLVSLMLLLILSFCILYLLGKIRYENGVFTIHKSNPPSKVVIIKPEPPIDNEQQKPYDLLTNYAESLKNSNEAIRNEAIDSLYYIAYKHPNHIKTVCEVFCSHIRDITNDSAYRKKNTAKNPPEDIQHIINRLLKNDGESLIFDSFPKNLQGAYLYGADFQNAKLDSVNFQNATLSKANFKSAKLNNVNFETTVLNEKVSFEDAQLTEVFFRYNKLTDVNFQKSKINRGVFRKTRLTGVNFDNAYFDVANFNESVMVEVSFRNNTLNGVSFRNASFSKNINFTNAKFHNVDFWTKIKPKKGEVIFKETIFEDIDIEKITSQNYTTRRTNP